MGAHGSKERLGPSKLSSFRRGASKKQRDAGRSASPLSDGSSNSSHGTLNGPRDGPRDGPRPPQAQRSAGPYSGRDRKRATEGGAAKRQSPQARLARAFSSGRGDERAQQPAKRRNVAAAAAAEKSVEMKTPTARKQAARRAVAAAAAAHKPTPLRDQNRLASSGDAVPAPLAKQHAVEAPLKALAAPQPPTIQPPATQQQQQQPPPPPPQLAQPLPPPTTQRPEPQQQPQRPGPQQQPQQPEPQQQPQQQSRPDANDEAVTALRSRLKNATAAFDALAIVLQHSIRTVEFLRKDERHADYDEIKLGWQSNCTLLGEIREKVVILEQALAEEKTKNLELLTEKENESSKLREEFDIERVKWVESTQAKVTSLEEKHQSELESLYIKCSSEHEKLIAERDIKLKLKTEEWVDEKKQLEATIGQLQSDHQKQEKLLQEEIAHLKSENCRLCNQLNIYAESSSKDSRLQACMTRCGELEEEVRSLQTVLDLRHQELQELRRRNGSLIRQAEQLPGALQRATLLQTRVEDLQAQIKEKSEYERQMNKEHHMLLEALQKEVKQRSRLSLLTEELQWKLKQNAEVVNALAAMNGSTTNVQVPSTSGASSPSVCRRNTNGTLRSISESSKSNNFAYSEIPSRLVASMTGNLSSSMHRSDVEEDGGVSPPPSPKIKGVVEKNDSVSWILEMEESSEELMSRLVRRTGSFRGTTSPPSTVVTQAQTLPPPKRRYKAGFWSPASSNALRRSSSKNDNTSTPKNATRSRSRSVSADSVDSIEFHSWGLNHRSSQNNEIVSVKNTENSLCNDSQNVVLWNNSTSEESPKHSNVIDDWNCMMPVFSNDESPTKSSGSSDCTSSDEGIRNHEDCNSPNTANLALLAACSAVQPPLLPKDAAGEAMISENEGDDDDDDDDDDEEDDDDVDNDEQEDDDHEDQSSSSDSSGLGLQSDTTDRKFELS